MHKCFDAAYPPPGPVRGCTAVLGYIGGNTPHIWTLAEWQRFKGLRQFPAWVCFDDPASPQAQAIAAAGAAVRLGWAAHYKPEPRVIVADMETMNNRAWYETFAAELATQGFASVAYGSLSTVLGNAAELVWAADWDDIPALDAGQSIEAAQYAADVPEIGGYVDLSVMSDALYVRGGIGPRR